VAASSSAVDVIAIARAAGLQVVFGPFDHAGMLIDGTTIEVPDKDPKTRQRFTVTHELGHVTLRHHVPADKLEVEANAFAPSSCCLARPCARRFETA
jgi:hypothetical protein